MESHDTVMGKNAILDAINAMRLEMNSKIDGLRLEMNERFDKVEARLTTVEMDVAAIKELQFSFDVRLERIEGMAYESLSIGHNLRADVKILRAGVGAWAKDVMRLEQQSI